jgi:hypothetical protein
LHPPGFKLEISASDTMLATLHRPITQKLKLMREGGHFTYSSILVKLINVKNISAVKK